MIRTTSSICLKVLEIIESYKHVENKIRKPQMCFASERRCRSHTRAVGNAGLNDGQDQLKLLTNLSRHTQQSTVLNYQTKNMLHLNSQCSRKFEFYNTHCYTI